MKNTMYGNLPEEVVREILLRLPVKTLIRFKCVSMEWNTLIGSSNFANQHFAHKTNRDHLLVRHYKAHEDKYAFALYVDNEYEEPDHLQILATIKKIVGPLNGVFCLINNLGEMAFLNPAMRQFKLLPDLVHSSYIEPHFSFLYQDFGFGLDPLSGHYKFGLVQYFWDEEKSEPYYPCVISVYNSSNDSWRHFEEKDSVNSNRSLFTSLFNTYLNEVYYWLMVHIDSAIVSILAFDMRNETFREIQAPNGINYAHVHLGLYHDSLVITCDEVDEFVDVWVMEMEGYWSRSIRIGPIEDIGWHLGLWNNNELLLETKTSEVVLSIYNVCTKTLRTFEAHKGNDYLSWVFIYKESLVSIKGTGDKCYPWDTSSDVVKDFFRRP